MSRFVSLILLIICLSCGSNGADPAHFRGNVMTIDYKIIVGKPLKADERTSIQELINNTFAEVNQIYNKWNPDSELSRLNNLRAGQKVTISKELAKLLHITHKVVGITEGRFDPTIEPLQALWKKHFEAGTEPSLEEIAAITPAIGWHNIHFDDDSFYKDHHQTQLDLGGIAKGYAVDLLVERLNKAGYQDLFVEWGGEIRCSGQHPDLRPWHICISRLGDQDPDHALLHMDLQNQAIATSGDYLQNWMIHKQDGSYAFYTHVIDPLRMQPLEMTHTSVASASVCAPTCVAADGIATALMLFPSLEEAEKWAQDLQNKDPSLSFQISSRQSLK